MKGVKAGKYPQQFELSEFERNAGCKMTFQGNPDIAKLNAKIRGNTRNLPPVEQRLPSEPLIYAPYDSIGKYGGTLDVLSNATEAGTSDFLSVSLTAGCHVSNSPRVWDRAARPDPRWALGRPPARLPAAAER